MNTDRIFMAIEDLDDTLELLDELQYSPINQVKERVKIIKNVIDKATSEIEEQLHIYVNTKILNYFYDLEEDDEWMFRIILFIVTI